jgi:hypothetical protein
VQTQIKIDAAPKPIISPATQVIHAKGQCYQFLSKADCYQRFNHRTFDLETYEKYIHDPKKVAIIDTDGIISFRKAPSIFGKLKILPTELQLTKEVIAAGWRRKLYSTEKLAQYKNHSSES